MCNCIAKMDERLAANNSRLVTTFTVRDGALVARPALRTEKLEPRKRDSMGAIPTFCPFCGDAYEPSAQASEVQNEEELVDLISEAISDSMDMDWTSTIGAKAVARALQKANAVRFGAAPTPAQSPETPNVELA